MVKTVLKLGGDSLFFLPVPVILFCVFFPPVILPVSSTCPGVHQANMQCFFWNQPSPFLPSLSPSPSTHPRPYTEKLCHISLQGNNTLSQHGLKIQCVFWWMTHSDMGLSQTPNSLKAETFSFRRGAQPDPRFLEGRNIHLFRDLA